VGYIGTKIRRQVWDKTGGRCWYCGRMTGKKPPTYHTRPTIDHMTPTSRGGSDDLSNLVPSCFICNLTKCDRTVEEYREFLALGNHPSPHSWVICVLEDVQKSLWYCRGELEDEVTLYMERFYAHTRAFRIVFYGEITAFDPADTYCI